MDFKKLLEEYQKTNECQCGHYHCECYDEGSEKIQEEIESLIKLMIQIQEE